MKIISIGTDEKLLEKGSRVYNRIKEYSQLAEEYYCFVFTKNIGFEKIIEEVNGNKFIAIPVFCKYKLFILSNLIKKIQQEKIINNGDVVISSQDAFEIGFFTWVISKILKYNFSVQIHTDVSSKYFRYESIRNFLQFLIFKFVIRNAKSIRVVSNRIKNYLVDKLKLDESKIYVAPIYVNLEATKPLSFGEGQGVRPNILLVMCRLEKVKNTDLAITSFLELIKDKKYGDFKLKIVGSGSDELRLKNKYKKYQNIIWEKFTDKPFLEYQKAKLFLITSKYEGWGMTAVESVASGTPVVMMDVGCANEFLFSNLNGQVVDKMKAKTVSESIKKVLKNLENYPADKLQSSLKLLQTKTEFLQTLKQSWQKALE